MASWTAKSALKAVEKQRRKIRKEDGATRGRKRRNIGDITKCEYHDSSQNQTKDRRRRWCWWWRRWSCHFIFDFIVKAKNQITQWKVITRDLSNSKVTANSY
jgi:hypothetical protein